MKDLKVGISMPVLRYTGDDCFHQEQLPWTGLPINPVGRGSSHSRIFSFSLPRPSILTFHYVSDHDHYTYPFPLVTKKKKYH